MQRLLQETTAGRPRARGRSAATCELPASKGKDNKESCGMVEEEQEWLAAKHLPNTVMDGSCHDSLRPECGQAPALAS